MRASDTLFGREVHEGSAEELPSLLKTRFPMGYYLILTDEESASALGKVLKRLLKKIFVVLREEDVLPLFSAPDAVTCVVGAGKAIAAARYFACVRSLPLVAVCFSCRPQGLGGRTASVNVCGENVSYPVPPPDLIFAADLQKGEREEAEAFLSACALSALSFDLCLRLGLPRREGGGKAAVFPPGRREPGNIGPAGAGERGAFSGGSRLRILFFRGISGRGDFCLRPPVGEICGPFAAAGAARMYRRAVRSVRPLFRRRLLSGRNGGL